MDAEESKRTDDTAISSRESPRPPDSRADVAVNGTGEGRDRPAPGGELSVHGPFSQNILADRSVFGVKHGILHLDAFAPNQDRASVRIV